jgi:hypothetical protein
MDATPSSIPVNRGGASRRCGESENVVFEFHGSRNSYRDQEGNLVIFRRSTCAGDLIVARPETSVNGKFESNIMQSLTALCIWSARRLRLENFGVFSLVTCRRGTLGVL